MISYSINDAILKKIILIPILIFIFVDYSVVFSQSDTSKNNSRQIAFVSDIQEPIFVEKLFLDGNKNEEASDSIFSDIVKVKPSDIFMLGDLVSLGFDEKQWGKIDKYLSLTKQSKIKSYAILGNHEVMYESTNGLIEFRKRFRHQSITGYAVIVDSIGLIMLNSNFGTLSQSDNKRQLAKYHYLLDSLDKSKQVKAIIVACHHPPFTNSKIVSSSKEVQKYFVKDFIKSKKSILFITGHSHNLEHFRQKNKDFIVIGGGGGLKQPLYQKGNRHWEDIIPNNIKPDFFYILVERRADALIVNARCLKKDFSDFYDLEIARIKLAK